MEEEEEESEVEEEKEVVFNVLEDGKVPTVGWLELTEPPDGDRREESVRHYYKLKQISEKEYCIVGLVLLDLEDAVKEGV